MRRKNVLCLLALMLLCLCATSSALAEVVGTAEALTKALGEGKDITLGADIALTESLEINNDTVIDMSGHTLTFSGLGEDGSAIQVKGKANLTIKNAGKLTTSDGKGRAILANGGGLSLQGNGWIPKKSTDGSNALIITNFHSSGNGGAVLIENGTLNARYVLFGEWSTYGILSADNGGAIYASNTAFSIDNCRFFLNDSTHAYEAESHFYGGGSLYISGKNSSGEIKNSYIWYGRSNNCGMGIHLDAVGGNVTLTNNWFYACQNNKISLGMNGGGAYVRICKNVTFDKNIFQQNSVRGNGGGITVIGGGTPNSTVTFRNNTITKNVSKNRGGGIYLSMSQKDVVNLESGVITDNTADSFGGGIAYTTHNMPTLKLKNVFISENSAVRGAGIWCCPTSETEMYSTVGGTIVGNTATGDVSGGVGKPRLNASGDDIRYEGKDYEDAFAAQSNPPSDTTMISVIDRAFNGIPIAWYSDETADRYQKGDSQVSMDDYQNRDTSFGLHGEISDDLIALAKKEALLVITGNSAGRGGGIASNSPIQIGEKNADMEVTVKKEWSVEEHPEQVKVDLYRIDEDGTRFKLDRDVVLSAENDWTYTFESLPAYTIGKDGVRADYTYTVEEQQVSGWDCTSQKKEANDGRTIIITLTNEPHIETPETPENLPTLPKTGDNSHMGLWMALMVLSMAGVVLLMERRRAQR